MRIIKMKKLRKFALIGFFLSFSVIIFFVFINTYISNKFILDLKKSIGTDVKVLYLYDNKNNNKTVEKFLKRYDIDYYSFNTSYISNKKEKKLKRFVNSNYIDNIILIYKGGKVVDAIIKNDKMDKLKEFLVENKLLTKYYDESVDILSKTESFLKSDLALIYIPYNDSNYNKDYQDMFNEICSNYNIEYKYLEAYKLGYFQKNKLNNILNISSVEDQIVVLVKDSKIVGNIRGIRDRDYYFLSIYNSLIKNLDNNLIDINISDFENMVDDDNVDIVLIGNDDSKDIINLKERLNDLILKYNIEINYLDVDSDHNINKVKEILSSIGYEGNLSLPITIILGKNMVLDYSIGLSEEKYYLDIFLENGIIKKEVEHDNL